MMPTGNTLVLTADLADVYNGSIRLLGDAQRFGLVLLNFTLEGNPAGHATARIQLDIGSKADATVVAARFRRHPTVRTIEIA